LNNAALWRRWRTTRLVKSDDLSAHPLCAGRYNRASLSTDLGTPETAAVPRIADKIGGQGRVASTEPANVRNWDLAAELIRSAKGRMSPVSIGQPIPRFACRTSFAGVGCIVMRMATAAPAGNSTKGKPAPRMIIQSRTQDRPFSPNHARPCAGRFLVRLGSLDARSPPRWIVLPRACTVTASGVASAGQPDRSALLEALGKSHNNETK
jgi:hypothetical protein